MNDVMEKCAGCRGHGMRHGAEGWPVDCEECGGSGAVRARDEGGRFVARALVQGGVGMGDETPSVATYEVSEWSKAGGTIEWAEVNIAICPECFALIPPLGSGEEHHMEWHRRTLMRGGRADGQ